MSNKKKENKVEENENIAENNVSFLYNNSNNSKNNKNNKNTKNSKNENKSNSLKKYLANQKELINDETLSAILVTSGMFKSLTNTWDSTPFQIKMGYLFILGTLLYYFLIMKFNLIGSLVIGILLFFVLFLINFYVGIIYLILLLFMIYNKYQEKIKLSGTLIKATEIKNNKPYNAMKNHEYVKSTTFPKEMTTGMFGYSFWLYINKPLNRDSLYRNNEWKSVFYRGTELDQKNDISLLTQYLGVWLTPNDESLAFVFQQNGSQTESFELKTLDFNVWTHYYVGVSPKSINIYKNGKLEVSSSINQSPISMDEYGLYITSDYALSQLEDISKTNVIVSEEDNVYSNKTGFDGYLAYLSYYEYSLSTVDIENSVKLYIDKINNFENSRKKKIENVDVIPIDFENKK